MKGLVAHVYALELFFARELIV
eukprot:SAG22_NODE_19823_length_271_cov_0.604651_1_plen_21_part_10